MSSETTQQSQAETQRPRLRKVILVNDDFTPREFVVIVLKGEFRMSETRRIKVMITAHKLGVCVVVAEPRQPAPWISAAAGGYPLQFIIEPEE